MQAFIIWCTIAAIFVIIGIRGLFSDKPVGFWANSDEKPEVTDVRAYNKAMCILWCAFAVIMAVLGIPLLFGQNSPWVMLSVFGVLVEIIVLMIVYIFVIERKYRKK